MIHGPQGRAGTVAALLHRLTGLALVVFLPLHFLALGLALQGAAALDSFLAWAEHPLVVASEVGLVAALVLHLCLGLRVLALEFLSWRGHLRPAAVGALAVAGGAGLLYLLASG
jgi:fumarate reductase subunit D